MDFGDIGENIPIIVMIVGLILLQFFLRRRRKPEITHQEIARNLLSEVRLDQALAEIFPLRQKPKKFETVSWQINRTKLDFLDESLQVALSDAFTTIEDFNRQIEAAKKHKSASYMVNVDCFAPGNDVKQFLYLYSRPSCDKLNAIGYFPYVLLYPLLVEFL